MRHVGLGRDLFPAFGGLLRYARRGAFIVSTALIMTALLAPVAAEAAELPQASAATTATPTIAELTAQSTEAAIAESRATNALTWLDTRLASARERLEASASRQTRNAIADEVAALAKQREALIADAEAARLVADHALAALRDAQAAQAATQAAAQAAEAARVREEQIVAYGLFPVAGPNEYIDSWGFARSGGRRHKGTDIMAATGTPVVATRDGVMTSGSNRLGGLILWLQADDGTRYYYAHLNTIVIGEGRVSAGTVIGTVGSTGNASASAPHLHFEIHRPEATNPYPELLQMAH